MSIIDELKKDIKMSQENEDKLIYWWENESERNFIVGGAAGCGKTTLIRQIPEVLDVENVALLAPTGKAAKVIGRGAKTIHSFLYIPVKDDKGGIKEWVPKEPEEFDDYDLLIIDEISMVSDEMMADLKATGVPIIGSGDPFQLPPVNGTNSILENPDILLTKVWRNDGGILDLATDIRERRRPTWRYDNVYLNFLGIERDLHKVDDNSIIICKFNKTRQEINQLYRKNVRKSKLILEPGEKLIVTKNNMKTGLKNGSVVELVQVVKVYKEYLLADIEVLTDENLKFTIKINLDTLMRREIRGFKDPHIHYVDYAYAITCHKAQGSEYDKVFIINEGRGFKDHRSWQYTAVTRAKKEVHIYN